MDSELMPILLLVFLVSASACTSSSQSGTVTEVTDGDTMDVETEKGEKTIRLIGVDSPETVGEVNPAEFGLNSSDSSKQCLREIGDRANKRAEKLEGRQVTVFQDNQQDRKGSYGRTLAYIYPENRSISFNEILLKEGDARFYRSDFAEKNRFRELERKAKLEEKGVWGCS